MHVYISINTIISISLNTSTYIQYPCMRNWTETGTRAISRQRESKDQNPTNQKKNKTKNEPQKNNTNIKVYTNIFSL